VTEVDERSPFLQHLEELRTRLIRSLLGIAVGFGLSYWKIREIFSVLIRPLQGAMREDSAIVLTDGMLRYLTLRETVAVIAHEISHIAGNDLWVMQLADTISRMTRMMSFVGIAIGLVSLPLMLLGRADMPWLAILLLVLAPGLASLLQMALSRTREFDADMEAATLTGDPAGLAMALGKIERIIRPLWQNIVLPHGRSGEPSLLRTHPATEERIARLRSLESFNNTEQGVEEPLSRVWPGAAPAGRRRLWW